MQPRIWNTLTEAAGWLTEATGETWDDRRVIDAVIQLHRTRGNPSTYPTIAQVIPPESAALLVRRFDRVPCDDPAVRRVEWQPVPLSEEHLTRLLLLGETFSGSVYRSRPGVDSCEIQALVPPVRVTLPAVVIAGADLPALAATADKPKPQAATDAPGAVRDGETPAAAAIWQEEARAIADELDARDRKAGAYSSTTDIADRVADEMRKRGVEGPRGPLMPANILREALQGKRWKRTKR